MTLGGSLTGSEAITAATGNSAQFTVAKHHRLERAVGVDARSSASNR